MSCVSPVGSCGSRAKSLRIWLLSSPARRPRWRHGTGYGRRRGFIRGVHTECQPRFVRFNVRFRTAPDPASRSALRPRTSAPLRLRFPDANRATAARTAGGRDVRQSGRDGATAGAPAGPVAEPGADPAKNPAKARVWHREPSTRPRHGTTLPRCAVAGTSCGCLRLHSYNLKLHERLTDQRAANRALVFIIARSCSWLIMAPGAGAAEPQFVPSNPFSRLAPAARHFPFSSRSCRPR